MDQLTDRTTPNAAPPPAPDPSPAAVLDLDPAGVVAVAETTEAEFMLALHDGAPAAAREALRMHSERVGGRVALVMPGDPTGGYWNKALGFGVTEPVTEELVAYVVDLSRFTGAPAVCLQLAPSVLPEDWADVCG